VDTRDHFAQASEVNTATRLTQAGGSTRRSDAVTSANSSIRISRRPSRQLRDRWDRELMPQVALQLNYSYTRTTDLFRPGPTSRRASASRSAITRGPVLSAYWLTARRTACDYVANGAKVVAAAAAS